MNALKNGRKAAQKMELRVKDLENELDGEQRRLADASKNLRKADRKMKEMEFQEEEDRKQQHHLGDLVDKLQQKVLLTTAFKYGAYPMKATPVGQDIPALEHPEQVTVHRVVTLRFFFSSSAILRNK